MAQQKLICAIAMLAVLVVVVGQVNCDLLPGFERCDNSGALVRYFFLDACTRGASKSPCKLRRGQTVSFALDFASATDFGELQAHFDVSNYGYARDACSSRLKCPGKAGQWQSVVQKIRLDDKLANALESDHMEFYLTDAKTNERLVCIRFPVEIEGGKKAPVASDKLTSLTNHLTGTIQLNLSY